MFIRLTEICTDGIDKTTIVACSTIKSFQYSTKGDDTHVSFFNKGYMFVRESLDEIWDMLNRA